MRFLLEAYRKQRRKLRIQHLLLLITRCIVIALIALALGRPLLEKAGLLGGATGTTLYVLIDNSLASSVRDAQTGETALDRHKVEARALLDGLGVSDRAALIALGGPAQGLVVPASSDISSVASLVRDVRSTDSAADIAGAVEQVAADIGDSSIDERGRVVVAVLSDFLEGSADPSRALPAALRAIEGVRVVASQPTRQSPSNVQIVDVEPLSPVILTGTGGSSGRGERENVRVKLRRSGSRLDESQLTTVRLRASGGEASAERAMVQQVMRWKAGQAEGEVTLQIEPAAMALHQNVRSNVLIAEIDRDAVTGDNVYRRPIALREALRVGVIGRRRFGSISGSVGELTPADWVRLALHPSDAAPIDVIDVDPSSIDAPVLASLDAVFVTSPELVPKESWGRMRGFADNGGLVVVTPSIESSVQLWTDVFESAMGVGWRMAREPIEYAQGISLDVQIGQSQIVSMLRGELPELIKPVMIWKMLPLEEWGRQADILLRAADGQPWVIASGVGEAATGEANGSGRPGTSGDRTQENGGAISTDDGRGLVVYLASAPSPEWTNLQATPLMLPLIQEMSRQGYGLAAGSWTAMAGRRPALPARTWRAQAVESSGTELEISEGGVATEAVRQSGVWEARDEAGRHLGFVAVNADPRGGQMQINDPEQVEQWLGSLTGAVRGVNGGNDSGEERVAFLDPEAPSAVLSSSEAESPLSLPLLIAALVLAICELMMARVFSHAIVDRGEHGVRMGKGMGSAVGGRAA